MAQVPIKFSQLPVRFELPQAGYIFCYDPTSEDPLQRAFRIAAGVLTGNKGATGDRGPQGIQGIPGDKGLTGDRGPVGDKGPAGANGDTGATGNKGPIGDQGPQGIQGPQGTKGVTGDKGEDGNGVAGVQGPPGEQGPIGEQGPAGDRGPTGLTGDKGPTGDKGTTGDKGLTGDKGAAGNTGNQGPIGDKGPQGDQGPAGNQGPAGSAGTVVRNGTAAPTNGVGNPGDFYIETTNQRLYGPKGASAWAGTYVGLVGATGGQGPQGVKGDTGAQGIQGAKGDTGTQGIQGIQGNTGTQGIQGTKGDKGDTGAQGTAGTNGTNGVDGKTLLNGSGAPTASQGVNGDYYLDNAASRLYGPKTIGAWGSFVSLIGAQGPKGDTGTTGAKGDTGAQGPTGPALPSGGNIGQYLRKAGIADYSYQWQDAPPGEKGATGDTGPKGDTGLQGIQGVAGAKGDTGSQGIQGIQGVAGERGEKGDNGVSSIPAGGTTGQILTKVSGANLDYQWATPGQVTAVFPTRLRNYIQLSTDFMGAGANNVATATASTLVVVAMDTAPGWDFSAFGAGMICSNARTDDTAGARMFIAGGAPVGSYAGVYANAGNGAASRNQTSISFGSGITPQVPVSFHALVDIPTRDVANAPYSHRIGVIRFKGMADGAARGVFMECKATDTNWFLVYTRTSSTTQNRMDTGILYEAGTVLFRFEFNGDGTFSVYNRDTLIVTLQPTNVFTGAAYVLCAEVIKTGGTASFEALGPDFLDVVFTLPR